MSWTGRPGSTLIEFILLFALWLYAFVRFMTRQRSGPGDDEARKRGADLERVIGPEAGQP